MFKFREIKKPHIFLIGAGGTGGFTLEFLTRLFAGQKISIDVYDGDKVELKNLKRQAFTLDDLDYFKVDALAHRLTEIVPEAPTINSHTEYIVSVDEFVAELLLNLEEDETPVIISALDNIATRRLVNEAIAELSGNQDVVAIDSGNNDQGGQVVLFSNYEIECKDIMGDTTHVNLPNMLQMFPEIDVIKDIHDENPGLVQNCADNAESKPQSMMANVRNADIISSIVYKLSNNESFTSNLWVSDLLTGSTSSWRRDG